MITVESAVKPSVIQNFCARNGTNGNFPALMAAQGAVGKSKQERQSSWLIAKGGTGRTLNDQWGTYLATKGYTTGTLKERMRAFFLNGTQA
jgi:hypothetical protein